jgi:hypothetical protein
MTTCEGGGATKWLLLVGVLVTSTACSRDTEAAKSPRPLATATVIIDAKISKGTRFIFYTNNEGDRSAHLPITAGDCHEYAFSTPLTVTSIRLDPTELADGEAEIRGIRFESAGQPSRRLPLQDLARFLKSQAQVEINPSTGGAVIKATRPGIYIMSTVDPKNYPSVASSTARADERDSAI